MRVLHVLDHSLPIHSGYSFRTRAILRAQQRAGMAVCGVTGSRHTEAGPPAETVDGLHFVRTPDVAGEQTGPVAEWRGVARLAEAVERTAREFAPHVIHAHSPGLNGLAGLRAARRLGLPLVYEIRAFWEDAAVGNLADSEGSLRYRLVRALENHVVSRADAVFTICHGLRDDLVARGHPPGRIGVSPNGVDLEQFGHPPPPDPALARELGLGSEGPVIGFVGSFYNYEGLDDLIAAMPRLIAAEPDAKLLLVGGGPMEAGLRAQADASSARGAITFAGRVSHDAVERYYALIDVLAYPRKRSRLTDLVTPLKPLEAMAQGRLVAASDVGGHRELMVDGETGVLFAPDDPAALADALARLCRKREGWDAMRARARAHVDRHHDWDRNVDRYRAVYHSLLGSPGDRAMSAAA